MIAPKYHKSIVVFCWFAFLLTMLLFTSCLGTKKSFNKETTSTEKTEVSKDSINETKVNQAINDRLTIPVSKVETADPVFNEKCTKIIDDLLGKINTQKQSGGNSYQAYYDLERRVLELQFLLAETQNQKVQTNNNTSSEKETTFIDETKKVVKTLPWWVWVILIIWFLPQILSRLQLIMNPSTIFTKK